MKKLTLLNLHGSFKYNTDIEHFFVNALGNIVKDTISKAVNLKDIDDYFIVSNNKNFLEDVKKEFPVCTEYVNTDKRFNFGEVIKRLINKHKWEKLFYIGAGAAPLITKKELASIAQKIKKKENIIIANNFYSSDFFAVSPAKKWNKISPLPGMDNPFAYKLKQAGNLESIKVKPSLGTFLDIDSPVDLTILKMHPEKGKFIKEFLDKYDLPIKKIKKTLPFFYDPFSEVFISGRIGSIIPNFLIQKAKCRFRLLSEECGMRAWGRESRGEVFSYLGELIEKIGFGKFFKFLSKTSKAAFIDTRVLFAHKKLKVSRADRFYSDMGEYNKIKEKYAKELTYEAEMAGIPVVLGGHSLISGGLYTLIESGELL
ncbi:MAG: hypothetical protein ABIH00_05665 [Armatimonadota bacterium]